MHIQPQTSTPFTYMHLALSCIHLSSSLLHALEIILIYFKNHIWHMQCSLPYVPCTISLHREMPCLHVCTITTNHMFVNTTIPIVEYTLSHYTVHLFTLVHIQQSQTHVHSCSFQYLNPARHTQICTSNCT